MAKEEKPEKRLPEYQNGYKKEGRGEVWCGQVHNSIEEAIVHAETNLGMRGQRAEPYWGTVRFTDSVVVGWKLNDRKRYRLEFTPEFQKENADAAKWAVTPHLKGTQGVHVNEENFDDPKEPAVSRVCHPTRAPFEWADLYWNKWTRECKQR